MTLTRQASAVLTLITLSGDGWTQAYPAKVVRTFANVPGGVFDFGARVMTPPLRATARISDHARTTAHKHGGEKT